MEYEPSQEEVLKMREKTGACMLHCKAALRRAKGNQSLAEEYLRRYLENCI